MSSFHDLYHQVYEKGDLFGLDAPSTKKILAKPGRRPNTVVVAGGALGDEGKGRVSDELTAHFLRTHSQVVHYRDNGGANAGHTVAVGDLKIALHQIGSGILQPGCIVIMGKEMVLHPEDLVTEISMVKAAIGSKKLPAALEIDEMAYLCLDTHRAFEGVLKAKSGGGAGATGRGISPAYADVLYRHPLRMRDLYASDWQDRVKKHYQLYQNLVAGFGYTLAELEVSRLEKKPVKVGSWKTMVNRLAEAKQALKPYVKNVISDLEQHWHSNTPFVFEKAQAIGLDVRWGVYPDVTASNCSFDGIHSASEGIIDPLAISVRAGTIKATYSSSVGSRKLPTMMAEKLAHRIREDAFEYGTTTRRPRDIAHIDLPMLSYLFKVNRVEELVMTHLDISYPEVPIKVCVAYKKRGQLVPYRPDQEYLNGVKAEYIELPSWDGSQLQSVTKFKQLPLAAQQYVAFISQALGAKPFMITLGPKRAQSIRFFK